MKAFWGPLTLAAGLLIGASGCVTPVKVLSSRIEGEAREGLHRNVLLRMELDTDLEAEKWSRHIVEFRYVILDETRLSELRKTNPHWSKSLEQAVKEMANDPVECFRVLDPRRFVGSDPDAELRAEGGVEPLAKHPEQGRFEYRVWIPLSKAQTSGVLDPNTGDTLERHYSMLNGKSYWICGHFTGFMALGNAAFESETCTLRIDR